LGSKNLTVAMFPYELPLSVIAASWKLYEQANRCRKIQIRGHWRPPIYRSWRGHVTYF